MVDPATEEDGDGDVTTFEPDLDLEWLLGPDVEVVFEAAA